MVRDAMREEEERNAIVGLFVMVAILLNPLWFVRTVERATAELHAGIARVRGEDTGVKGDREGCQD